MLVPLWRCPPALLCLLLVQNFFLYFFGMVFNFLAIAAVSLWQGNWGIQSLFDHQDGVTLALIVNNALQVRHSIMNKGQLAIVMLNHQVPELHHDIFRAGSWESFGGFHCGCIALCDHLHSSKTLPLRFGHGR